MGMRAGEAPRGSVREASEARPLNDEEITLSETRRKHRKLSGQQKQELVLASLRGEKCVAALCREHELSDMA
jgi:hypothetical protein